MNLFINRNNSVGKRAYKFICITNFFSFSSNINFIKNRIFLKMNFSVITKFKLVYKFRSFLKFFNLILFNLIFSFNKFFLYFSSFFSIITYKVTKEISNKITSKPSISLHYLRVILNLFLELNKLSILFIIKNLTKSFILSITNILSFINNPIFRATCL